MKKVFILLLAGAMSYTVVCGQQVADSIGKVLQLEEITVSGIRVHEQSSVAHSNLDEKMIKRNNAAKNIPALLQSLPSIVSYTEGGTSVGNTSFRIRGTDATRINMTLNGMPLNNPETQEVYWVNIPDLANSLKNLQLQRGVGTSAAGTASFGGSISMQTIGSQTRPYADKSISLGQYNTFLSSIAAGSGILKNGLSMNARYSYTRSDGYIRNGKVNHKNLYATISHYTAKQMIRLIYINGIQHTGITWEGISPLMKERDRRYNPAGEYVDDKGLTRYYGNETDNYYSHILQGLYTRRFTPQIDMSANVGYNNGYGYYENYKTDQKFSKFGLPNQVAGGVLFKSSDIIRRKLMSNDLYSLGAHASYKTYKTSVNIGTNYSHFLGKHYGRLLWIKRSDHIPINYEWYRNDAKKDDFSSFLKFTYSLSSQLLLEAEVQARFVNYKMEGIDDDLAALDSNNSYSFFNPKIGIQYRVNHKNHFFASFAISNREPIRADLKESIKGGSVKSIDSERLFDTEMGYHFILPNFLLKANFYHMQYKNQLILTGKLSDTGYKYQENVPKSYRYGVELEFSYRPSYWLALEGNITWSQNKIKNYTAYYDVYDNQKNRNWVGQQSEYYKRTNISFSPNIVGALNLTIHPIKKENLYFMFSNKLVGSMFYDNTSNSENKLPKYFTTDFHISYSRQWMFIKNMEIQFGINNLFNKKYDANAWVETVKFSDGTNLVYKGLFPQTGTNVMGRIAFKF